MKTMNGTNHSTSGFPNFTGGGPATKLRVAGLVFTALVGSILVIWVNHTTWERVDNLQRQFASLKADSFYRGVRMRNDIERLNDSLLRYRLRGDPADAEAFHSGTRDFKQRLEQNSTNTATPLEIDFFQRIRTAYDDYSIESEKVLEASRARWSSTQAKDFQVSYEKVQKQSEQLLSLCDTFIDNQRSTFDAFLRGSDRTLVIFKRLLHISAVLLLALAAALLLLVYRGMIAPLRLQLTESQAIIARQEKLAALGVLAAGVAHEIRNPLTAIKFRLFSLKKSLAAAAQEDADVIAGEISRLERIVKDFLEFARPSEPELVALPAQRIMQEVHDLLRPQLEKSAIKLTMEASEPVWVRADIQQIKQVLINLIQNSADSIGRDGVITLRVSGQSGPARNGLDGIVVMEVADTGKGIPPEVQKRLFDPFFTTKEGGTGLGLPIAARIVEKHGGKLHYQTAQNRGTTFRVVLPQTGKNES
jgi:signal transduction histidine kinase